MQRTKSELEFIENIGKIFKEKRFQSNLTTQDVATKLILKNNDIIGFEDNRPQIMNPNLYLFGFARSYAKLINIDYDEIINKKHIAIEKEDNFSNEHEIDVFYGKELLPTRDLTTNLLLVLLTIYLILFSCFDLPNFGNSITIEQITKDLEIIKNESNI